MLDAWLRRGAAGVDSAAAESRVVTDAAAEGQPAPASPTPQSARCDLLILPSDLSPPTPRPHQQQQPQPPSDGDVSSVYSPRAAHTTFSERRPRKRFRADDGVIIDYDDDAD